MTNDPLSPVSVSDERRAPVQGYAAGIPWSLHLEAYDAYCKRYGKQQALIEGWCRGGFGTGELDEYIPGWRDKVSEIGRLKAEVANLRAALSHRSTPDQSWHAVGSTEPAVAEVVQIPNTCTRISWRGCEFSLLEPYISAPKTERSRT